MFKMSTASLQPRTQADKRRRHWRIAACVCSVLWRLRDPDWTTALPSQKIFNYPPACLVHCDGACQKLRNQMQNYLKYTNKTSGTYFRAM